MKILSRIAAAEIPSAFLNCESASSSQTVRHRFLLIENALLSEIINGQKNILTNNPLWFPRLARRRRQKAEGQCRQSALSPVQIFQVASSLGLAIGLYQNIGQLYLSWALWLTAKLARYFYRIYFHCMIFCVYCNHLYRVLLCGEMIDVVYPWLVWNTSDHYLCRYSLRLESFIITNMCMDFISISFFCVAN